MDVKEYAKVLVQEAGLTGEAATQFEQALLSEKVSKRLGADLKRHDEFARDEDALRKDKEAYLKEKDGWLKWYDEAVRVDGENRKAREAAEKQLAAYREQYGEPEGATNGKPANPAATYLSKEEFDKAQKERDQIAWSVMKDMQKCSSDYARRFGKDLDLDALEKFALENRLPLNQAYKQMIEPEVETQRAAETQKKIDQGIEDGMKDRLSKLKLPVDSTPQEPHQFFDRLPPEKAAKTDRELAAEFAAGWNEATAASK